MGFLQNWNITPVLLTFLAMLAIYRRQRIWLWQCPVNHMWLYGRLCLVLAEFMVTWSWQNALQNEFCQWNLTMLLVMCCCETSMVLLATTISVRMLNSTDKKRV
jgi:hypothetical protein